VARSSSLQSIEGQADHLRSAIIARIAALYPGRWLRGYVRGKLRSDPIYAEGVALLKDSALPVLDVGCGVGLFACWLREHGCAMPVHGYDLDAEKIAKAQRATASYDSVTFQAGDATRDAGQRGNLVVFDVLHFFAPEERRVMLERFAEMVPAGGRCVIRTTIGDGSWRFRITRVEDWLLRAIRWMNSDAVHYPAIEEICAPFRERGFECEVRPLWGGTPFNSYLFVFRAPLLEATVR
jgi:2-polyprenyl-3-methyl-5-hydroxy-6-metoxy-1,4-benzoquinol methylase